MAIYDAFISYSHAKDKPIATALQSVVQTLGKPWYRRRALRIFRDDTSLSATPHLWPSIELALGQSRFLILLASQEAAASPWVNREVAYWLDHKSADTLLIALTEGALAWDEATGDFRWSMSTPLPPAIKGRFPNEPKWVDLQSYRGARARDHKFRERSADFAAAIHGVPKEDLLSQELRQQRRALTLAWSAAASLLFLAGAAVWQWTGARAQRDRALESERVAIEQRTQAQAQRDRAEGTLRAGTDSANDFILNVAVRMRQTIGMPVDLVRDILNRAQELQDKLIKFNETDPKLRRSRAVLLRETSQTLLSQGDRTDALEHALRSRDIMDELVAADGHNLDLKRELSLTYNRIGEALSQLGQREEALESFRDALAIRRELASASPNTERQLALALSHERVGDELLRLHQRDEALQSFRTSFETREQIVQREPNNLEAQRVLAVSYDRIGLTLGGSSREAFEAYGKSLAIRERLADAEPRNAVWQRDLATSQDNVGTYLLKIDNRDEALAFFRRALAIREMLAAGDPKNSQWQILLVISHVKLAEADEEPVANYTRALQIVTELERAGRLSDNQSNWRSDLEGRLASVTR